METGQSINTDVQVAGIPSTPITSVGDPLPMRAIQAAFRFTSRRPRPLVLHLDCRVGGLPAINLWAENIFLLGGAAPQLGALVRVDYGAGAASQFRIIDLQSGSYQLPPCTFAEARVMFWAPTSSGPTPEVYNVSGGFAEGVMGGAAKQATRSAQFLAGGAANTNATWRALGGEVWSRIQVLTALTLGTPTLNFQAAGQGRYLDWSVPSMFPVVPDGMPTQFFQDEAWQFQGDSTWVRMVREVDF